MKVGYLAKLMGAELTRTLKKESIDAYIHEHDLQGGAVVVFHKVVRILETTTFPRDISDPDYHLPPERVQYEVDSLETIIRETYNLKAELPGIVKDVVETFNKMDSRNTEQRNDRIA